MKTHTVTIINPLGLHTRAAMKLVNLADRYQSEIILQYKHHHVNAKSILNVMTLGAAQGATLTVTTNGPDETAALAAIIALFEAGFDEC